MKDVCLTCGFYDSDYGCNCSCFDKWYACPIESKKSENIQALRDYAQWVEESGVEK